MLSARGPRAPPTILAGEDLQQQRLLVAPQVFTDPALGLHSMQCT